MVKATLFFGLILIFTVTCTGNRSEASVAHAGQDEPFNTEGKAKIEFREVRYDFGTVSSGEKLAYTFIYKNTGDGPLVINSSSADCGCTVPEYDSKPLAPGKEGKLKVIFDTRGFSGYQVKSVHVFTNAENPMVTLAMRALIE